MRVKRNHPFNLRGSKMAGNRRVGHYPAGNHCEKRGEGDKSKPIRVCQYRWIYEYQYLIGGVQENKYTCYWGICGKGMWVCCNKGEE
jgi:hypothetical protein